MMTTNPQETTPDLEQSRDPMAQMMAAVERLSRQVQLQQMQLEQMCALSLNAGFQTYQVWFQQLLCTDLFKNLAVVVGGLVWLTRDSWENRRP